MWQINDPAIIIAIGTVVSSSFVYFGGLMWFGGKLGARMDRVEADIKNLNMLVTGSSNDLRAGLIDIGAVSAMLTGASRRLDSHDERMNMLSNRVDRVANHARD